MLLMYANGSANSSGVGRNTGHCGTSTLFVRRWSLTLALMARCISASLKSPELASSLRAVSGCASPRGGGRGRRLHHIGAQRCDAKTSRGENETKRGFGETCARATSPPAGHQRRGPWGFTARRRSSRSRPSSRARTATSGVCAAKTGPSPWLPSRRTSRPRTATTNRGLASARAPLRARVRTARFRVDRLGVFRTTRKRRARACSLSARCSATAERRRPPRRVLGKGRRHRNCPVFGVDARRARFRADRTYRRTTSRKPRASPRWTSGRRDGTPRGSGVPRRGRHRRGIAWVPPIPGFPAAGINVEHLVLPLVIVDNVAVDPYWSPSVALPPVTTAQEYHEFQHNPNVPHVQPQGTPTWSWPPPPPPPPPPEAAPADDALRSAKTSPLRSRRSRRRSCRASPARLPLAAPRWRPRWAQIPVRRSPTAFARRTRSRRSPP